MFDAFDSFLLLGDFDKYVDDMTKKNVSRSYSLHSLIK